MTNSNPDKIREELQKLDHERSRLLILRRQLERECPHQFYLSEKEKKGKETDPWWSVLAYCDICGLGFGWLCKKSPDGVCHYFSKNGFVNGIHGEKIPVPEGYNSEKWETSDVCIFCGMGEERK